MVSRRAGRAGLLGKIVPCALGLSALVPEGLSGTDPALDGPARLLRSISGFLASSLQTFQASKGLRQGPGDVCMADLATTESVAEDRILEAFEYAASGMALTDLQGPFQRTNPTYRAILGRTEDQLHRETILSVTHEEDRDGCSAHLNRLVSGEIPSFVLEKRYLRPNNQAIWVRNSFSLLKGPNGCPIHIIVVCNDITERRRAEQLLFESEKLAMVGQLTSSIAHEINNPLETVMNLLYLAREADSFDAARRFVSEAELEVQRIAEIADHTLRFPKEQITPTRTNIAELVLSVLTVFKGKLHQSGIELHFDKRSNPELICYPGEIRQLLANLLRNAMDAMPGGGTLRIRLRTSSDWRTGTKGVRMLIADTGCGMDEKTRDRIYEPFFTTKGDHGTGLGLWITAGILSKHQGSMHVRSSNVVGSSWTVFALIFPLAGAEGKPPGLKELQ